MMTGRTRCAVLLVPLAVITISGAVPSAPRVEQSATGGEKSALRAQPSGARGEKSALRAQPSGTGGGKSALHAQPSATHAATIGHELRVVIAPETSILSVEDTITLPPGRAASLHGHGTAGVRLPGRTGAGESFYFLLHAGLHPVAATAGVSLELVNEPPRASLFGLEPAAFEIPASPPLELFRVTLPSGVGAFTLRYSGTIHHPVTQEDEDYARSFGETPGTISSEGVFLSRASYWYPWFGNDLVTFTLASELPAGWEAVSQGAGGIPAKGRAGAQGKIDPTQDRPPKGSSSRWESPEPQDEIFLVAARFTRYEGLVARAPTPVEFSTSSALAPGLSADAQRSDVRTMAFLREPDANLASRYLEAAGQYIGMYERLLGPYPYPKFALVENFWETGYGMPSFTLLGSKVIRLPFIINSSYPHEILHNWWGNGVYVDYATGNWCEGLTAYLADHLIQEQQGSAAEYRQTTLQKYADYVSRAKDFPLARFRERHSPATEAVGYGKSLMFFHMLRRDLGDEPFIRGLQTFYREHRFQPAGFDDLRVAMEASSGRKLDRVFAEWVTRAGAPGLRVASAKVRTEGSDFVLALALEQDQAGAPYSLNVPIAVTLEGREAAWEGTISMEAKRKRAEVRLPARPLRLDVDPRFDLFRRLDRNETPPALSQAFGAERTLVLLPAAAPADLLAAYRLLAEEWRRGDPDRVAVSLDSEVARLPEDRSVWIFGWENRFRAAASEAAGTYGAALAETEVRLGGATLVRANHSFALTARRPGNPGQVIAFVASDGAAAVPGLGRKLPHYHKYSYLAFEGEEPTNVAKGRWPVVDSPMTVVFEKSEMAKLAPRTPLATLPPAFSKERMMETVGTLAGEEMRGRGFGSPELERAASFIASKFREAGLQPGGDRDAARTDAPSGATSGNEPYFASWTDRGGDPEHDAVLKNVVGIIPGRKPELAGQSIVIGAHYDHLGLGWPDAKAGNAGRVHPGADDNASGVAVLLELARQLGQGWIPDRNVVFVAFAGEEAGRRGSKRYVQTADGLPASKCVGMLNLDTVGRLGTGKLNVLGTGSAREWIHIFNGAGYVTGVPIQAVAEDIGGSDQKSFTEAGVPAVQLFSGANLDYHAPSDTADKIDPDGLVKVALVAREAIDYLAGRAEPLTLPSGTPASPGPRPAVAGEHGGMDSAIPAGGPESGGVAAPDGKGAPGEGAPRRVSLGTIPDFAYAGSGVRLTGVVPGSPAEKAGMKEGDIVVAIGKSEVKDLRALSEILKALHPGDKVAVTFMRDGRSMSSEAELAAR